VPAQDRGRGDREDLPPPAAAHQPRQRRKPEPVGRIPPQPAVELAAQHLLLVATAPPTPRPWTGQSGSAPPAGRTSTSPTGRAATAAPRAGASHATDPAAKPQLTLRDRVSERDTVSTWKVGREDRLRLGFQELPPCLAGPPGRGVNACVLEGLPYRRRRELVSQAGHLAVDAPVPPGGVVRPEALRGRRIVVTRVPKVPESAPLAQPNAEACLPRYSGRHQVNGCDRVIGTTRHGRRTTHTASPAG
jgi:hypothetical protein